MKLLLWTAFTCLVSTTLFSPAPVGEGSRPIRGLTDTELKSLDGKTTTCHECTVNPVRQDECYHAGQIDDCSSESCLNKYICDDTCRLSAVGSCYADVDEEATQLIQYHRIDNNCQTNNTDTWAILTKRYYGTSCNVRVHLTRCQKTCNSCNGTLISMTTVLNGIECQ